MCVCEEPPQGQAQRQVQVQGGAFTMHAWCGSERDRGKQSVHFNVDKVNTNAIKSPQ